MKFDDRSHEETERQQRCARSKAWNLAKNMYKLKEKDKAAFYFPAEEWLLTAASTKEPEDRKFVVDSGASVHMVCEKYVNFAELETMRTSRSPTTVMTARCKQEKKRQYMSSNLTYLSKLCFLEKLPQFFPWANSVRTMGIHTTGPAVKNLISSEMAREWIAICPTLCHLWFLVYRSSSTTPSHTSPSSSSQDTVFDVNRYTENTVPERSGSTSEELRGDPLHESTEIENKKKEEREEVPRDISSKLTDWLQEFRDNLVDESTSTEPWRNPEQGSQDTSKSFHELPMEPRAKVEQGSGKQSVYTHFFEGPKF